METTTTCQGSTKAGQPCRGYAQAGSRFCFTHDPEKAKERQQARRRGGKARHGRAIGTTGEELANPVTFSSVADILAYLERAASDLAKLENSVARARAMIALAQTAMGALEVGDLEARLAVLEAALARG